MLPSGGAKPVSVGAEAERVDDVAALQRVQMLALVQIPEHGAAVLATAGAQRTVGRHGHAVQVAAVAHVVSLQLAVSQIPDLDHSVPSSGDDDGVGGVGREPNAGNPVGVTFLLDGILADSKGVPQLDCSVPGSTDDLTVVGRESHTEDILGVTIETTSGFTSEQIPQSESVIPGS